MRLAYVLTGSHSSAEDLVQAALVKTAVRWRRVVADGDPEAYVRRVLLNQHITWWRRVGRRETPVAAVPDRADPRRPDEQVGRLDLAAALAKLGPRQRAVIVLRFYADMSEAQTAEALGCAVGTVKSQTADALARLRRLVPPLIDDGAADARTEVER